MAVVNIALHLRELHLFRHLIHQGTREKGPARRRQRPIRVGKRVTASRGFFIERLTPATISSITPVLQDLFQDLNQG